MDAGLNMMEKVLNDALDLNSEPTQCFAFLC